MDVMLHLLKTTLVATSNRLRECPHLRPHPQGRLKRAIALDDLQCGSWYTRPLHLPAGVILYPAVEWLGRRSAGEAVGEVCCRALAMPQAHGSPDASVFLLAAS